jgi:hypothetical protein
MPLLGLALCLTGCDRLPESYAPPEQRHPVEGYNPGPDPMMVAMSDPDASQHIVKDIYPPNNPAWRWTGQNPTVQLPVLSNENMKVNAEFLIWEVSFPQTGPLEITFLVNGRQLDKVRYTAPGLKHFEKPVPAEWLAVNTNATLAMYIDKLYVTPRDGLKFGVILTHMGFKPE